MTSDEKSKASKKEKPVETTDGRSSGPKDRAPLSLLLGSWLVPGLGHWLLGKKRRAAVFAVVIACSFVTGVLLQGEIGTPKPGNPFSWLAAFACLGNGLLSIVRLVWLNGIGGLVSEFPFGLQGGGSPSAAGFAYGNTFLYTAGLMNLLAVLDVSDIARGDKD
jgi:hypothetical protein